VICQKCNIHCKTCDGPTDRDCITCDLEKYTQEGKYCKKICFDKQTYFSNQECPNCDRSCKTCSSFQSSECETCFPGYTLVDVNLFQNIDNSMTNSLIASCSKKCCVKCPDNCNKCYPTKNHDPNSKDIMVNKPITCIKCEDGFSLTSPDTCTANELISTKIDLINYYYWP
jgi:hypothetical protein